MSLDDDLRRAERAYRGSRGVLPGDNDLRRAWVTYLLRAGAIVEGAEVIVDATNDRGHVVSPRWYVIACLHELVPAPGLAHGCAGLVLRKCHRTTGRMLIGRTAAWSAGIDPVGFWLAHLVDHRPAGPWRGGELSWYRRQGMPWADLQCDGRPT